MFLCLILYQSVVLEFEQVPFFVGNRTFVLARQLSRHNHVMSPNTNKPYLIWFIHYLFLAAMDEDAQEWAEAWNSHKLQCRHAHQASPREIFMFGMVREGPRGIEYVTGGVPAEDEVAPEDIQDYRIDWEAADDTNLMAHLLENNPQECLSLNPFQSTTTPSSLSDVPVDPPHCPFSNLQISSLNSYLMTHFDLSSQNMLIRRSLWIGALAHCSSLFYASST